MYDLLEEIIGYQVTTTSLSSTLIYGCIVIICVLLPVIIDLIYRIFRHFWR